MALINAAFTGVDAVKPFKTTWRIQVKILHSWMQYSTYTGETLEMILADASGNLIHATVKKQQVSKFKDDIVVGKWRIIQNFTVSKAMGKFRPSKYMYKIAMMNTTIITQCDEVSDDVYLDLANFEDVTDVGGLNENILIDVIGQVVNVGEMTTHQVANKTSNKIEFELRNTGDDRLRCHLWGKFAEALLDACKSGAKRLICLIRFAKINVFNGERYISSAFDISMLFLDPQYQAAIDFVSNLPDDGMVLTMKVSVPPEQKEEKKVEWANQFPRFTISDLLDCKDVGKFRIICTICSVHTDFAWYYFSCQRCSKTAYKVPKVENQVVQKNKKPLFWCGTCGENTTRVVPRYKLIINVMDGTGTTKCMLWDRDATSIVSYTAIELLEGHLDEIDDPENLPRPLFNLKGKTFQFLVCNEDDNIEDVNDTYKVAYLFNGLGSEKVDSICESESHLGYSNAVSVDPEAMMLTNISDQDEALGNSSITPLSKRKDGSSEDGSDQSSASKKLCIFPMNDVFEADKELDGKDKDIINE